MRHKLGFSILTWSPVERRSGRYGRVMLDHGDNPLYAGTTPWLDRAAVLRLDGCRVRLTCRVLVARDSHHARDRFLGVFPTRPRVGEEVTLGVGTLAVAADDNAAEATAVGLRPSDGRQVC